MRIELGVAVLVAASIVCGPAAHALDCEDPEARSPAPNPRFTELHDRVMRYADEASKHRLYGLASYYSQSLDGTLTANGERYRSKGLSAAHLTLPLGTWVVVRSIATGKKVRLRVNDRGPYAHKFVIDLSHAAAQAIGVDSADDRRVNIWIVDLAAFEEFSAGW